MRRALLVAAAAALVAVVAAGPLWVPAAGRRIAWFEVQRVEVSGTRLLAPHEVLAASGIRRDTNVWDDPQRIERALLAQPAIASAHVTRYLPHTLRIRVEEKEPVAYVEDGMLRPATARGEILPLDPTRAPLDLPIVRGRWAPGDTTTLKLLAETARLERLDPALLAEVSEVRRAPDTPATLLLLHRAAQIVVPIGMDASRLTQLHAVLADLARRAAPNGKPAAALPRVDLRFADQVVVRLPSSAPLS